MMVRTLFKMVGTIIVLHIVSFLSLDVCKHLRRCEKWENRAGDNVVGRTKFAEQLEVSFP